MGSVLSGHQIIWILGPHSILDMTSTLPVGSSRLVHHILGSTSSSTVDYTESPSLRLHQHIRYTISYRLWMSTWGRALGRRERLGIGQGRRSSGIVIQLLSFNFFYGKEHLSTS